MRRYLLAFVVMLVSKAAYAQTNLNATSGCPNTPPYNNALCWSTASNLWQYGVGGAWTNQAGSGGATPVGANGTLQASNGAGALAAYAGSSCTNQVGIGLSALGAETCHTITTTDTDTTIAKTGTDVNTSNQVTATHLASPLPAAQGGSGVVSPTAHSLLLGEGASAFGQLVLTNDQLVLGSTGADPTPLSVTNCTADAAHAEQYSTSTHSFQCNAITATATPAGPNFSLQYDNSGALGGASFNAVPVISTTGAPTALAGNTLAAHNFATTISPLGVITGAQPLFTDISGSVASTQMPALTGDTTTSAGATVTTTGKVNGVTYPASPSTHQAPIVTASNTVTYKTVPDCQDSVGNHLNYTQSTDSFSCGTTNSGNTGFVNATTSSVALSGYGGL